MLIPKMAPKSQHRNVLCTGKSLLVALIFASTNPQYDKRLFIDLPVQYMKTTSSEHVVYINCSECQKIKKTICVHNMFWAWNFHVLNWWFKEQSVVILWVSWCKNKSFWQSFTCNNISLKPQNCNYSTI